MANLPLSDLITQESRQTRNYRIIEIQFGDGYSQRAGDGINTRRDSWFIVWAVVDGTERNTILSALETAGGFDTLSWQAPGDAASKEWRTIGDVQVEAMAGDLFRISVEIREEFDLTV